MRPDYSRGEYDLEALEPRLLLSADPIASLLDPAAQPKDKWGESVSVALMQTTATEGVNAASVKPVDYLDVADEPLTAPAPTFATPAVENSIVTQTTSSRSSALTVDGVKSIDAEGLVLRSQTQLSAQSVVTAQQVTSLNASNGPPEMSALAAGPVTPGAYSNLLTFITDTLNDAASGTLPATITDTYTFTNELTLGSVFKIQNASVTFNITVSGTSAAPVWNGTISISAGTVSLTLGSIASAVVTDGVDANLDGLSATYTLSNATATTGGTFSLNLDQITLTAFSGSLSATGSNFTLAYSPTTGLSNSDLNFNPVTVSLGAGASTVVNASGSGLVQVTETGVAAAINLTLSQGPSFAGQSIALSGTFKLRLNTTGVPVTSISGIAVDLPSPGGATYLKVIVQDASLTLSGATLPATELPFEKA